jgi:hypothetical protein
MVEVGGVAEPLPAGHLLERRRHAPDDVDVRLRGRLEGQVGQRRRPHPDEGDRPGDVAVGLHERPAGGVGCPHAGLRAHLVEEGDEPGRCA